MRDQRLAGNRCGVPIVPVAALCALALVAAAPARGGEKSGELTPIFDGRTLEGWHRLGGKARYTVEDGQIVGRAVPGTPNSFLCTKKLYGDFVLELDYKVDPHLNSGVQIRSNAHEKPERFYAGGKWRTIPPGRVHGYQVEIDPSPRAWSAGIYDEGRRGWLFDLSQNEAARKAFRQGEWNHYRVVASGDSIRTWINGVAAADLVDSMTLEGFIGLQVHGVGRHPERAGAEVRWRDIRLQDMGRHVWRPLWDGKTLEGWSPEGGGRWTVEKGVLAGRHTAADRKHGHLFLSRPLGDFTIRLEFKSVKGNSGFYFRTEKTSGSIGIAGFQAEIDPEKSVGGLYETAGRGWVVNPDPKTVAGYFRPGDWNEMTVSAHGRRIVVHVNGTRSAEVRDDPGRTRGFIALQIHGGQDVEVLFRRIEILEKEKAAGRDG